MESQKSECDARNPGVAEDAAVDETSTANCREPAYDYLLLQIGILIQAFAVSLWRIIEVSDESVFVFDAITQGGLSPRALGIASLVFHAPAIDMIDFVRCEVELKAAAIHS